MLGTLVMTGGSLYAAFKLYHTIIKEKLTLWLYEPDQLDEANTKLVASQEVNANTILPHAKQKAQPIQQGLFLSSISLGIATTGTLFCPPLRVISIAPLLYLGGQTALNAAKSLWYEERPNIALLDTVIVSVGIIQGYYIPISLFFCFDYLSQNSIYQGLEKKRQTLSNLVGKPEPLTWVLKQDVEVEVPTEKLQTDQIVVVHAGELVPVDGRITDGYALLDEHLLTATRKAIIKSSDALVFAGTMVLVGRICVKIERAGQATHQAQMANILTDIQHSEPELSEQFTLLLLCLGSIASFVLQPIAVLALMGTRFSFEQVGALDKATYLEHTLRTGILIRDGRVLLSLSQVKSLVIEQKLATSAPSVISQLREHVESIYFFENTPPLQQVLNSLQFKNELVCYVGYEVPSAMQHLDHVSISVGGISDIPSDWAQIVLLDGTLNQLGMLFELAKSYDATYRRRFMIGSLPAIFALSAPFLLHTGLMMTILLNQIGLLSAVAQSRKLKNLPPD